VHAYKDASRRGYRSHGGLRHRSGLRHPQSKKEPGLSTLLPRDKSRLLAADEDRPLLAGYTGCLSPLPKSLIPFLFSRFLFPSPQSLVSSPVPSP
jgi:hypothetical protein